MEWHLKFCLKMLGDDIYFPLRKETLIIMERPQYLSFVSFLLV